MTSTPIHDGRQNVDEIASGHDVVMLIVHATRKLAQRLGGFAPTPTTPSTAPALSAWCATAILWNPQVMLLMEG